MPRQSERRPSRTPQSDSEHEGCFGKMMDFLLLDAFISALADIGCSGCLWFVFTTVIAIAFLAHGMSHLITHRPTALAWRPIRAF